MTSETSGMAERSSFVGTMTCMMLLLSVWCSGCATSLTAPKEAVGIAGDQVVARPAASLALDTAAPSERRESGPSLSPDTPAEETGSSGRLLIYQGDFQLLVANVEEAADRFAQDIEKRGGYLQIRDDATLTFRVPAPHFRPVVDGLTEFGVVVSESIRAQDVTRQYQDLTLRLTTLEKSLQRLARLLERAEEVEEVLQIEKEMRRLTTEIERLKGERRYLDSQIAFSTITVEFRSNAPSPCPIRGRKYSRFSWINQVGLEQTLERF